MRQWQVSLFSVSSLQEGLSSSGEAWWDLVWLLVLAPARCNLPRHPRLHLDRRRQGHRGQTAGCLLRRLTMGGTVFVFETRSRLSRALSRVAYL